MSNEEWAHACIKSIMPMLDSTSCTAACSVNYYSSRLEEGTVNPTFEADQRVASCYLCRRNQSRRCRQTLDSLVFQQSLFTLLMTTYRVICLLSVTRMQVRWE